VSHSQFARSGAYGALVGAVLGVSISAAAAQVHTVFATDRASGLQDQPAIAAPVSNRGRIIQFEGRLAAL
jgi:hypothetical protein